MAPCNAAMADEARNNRLLVDAQAERAVLAAALLDADNDARVVPRVAAILSPADFHDPRHATLWESVLSIHRRGDHVDVVTVAAELRARDRLNAIGGPPYIGSLTDEIPTLAHCEAHARIVLDLARHRRAVEAYRAATSRLLNGAPLESVQAEVGLLLRGAQSVSPVGRVADDLDDLLDAMWAAREGQRAPVTTPWAAVNGVLGGGLWPGMHVLVGGTGSGKTQWAVQASVAAARAGIPVLYLALELSRRDMAARVVGALSGAPWSQILRGTLSDAEIPRVVASAREARTLPLHTECGAPYGYGAETLAARAWALRPQLIVLDYLQLCAGRHGEEPRTAVGRISYVARTLARDLDATVLVLSSTARANYAELVNDPTREPGDMVGLGKESGEIEYAADSVIVLAKHAQRPRSRVLVVAKNRHGPLGRAELEWTGTSFVEGDLPEEISL